jgi:hypothetical protein
MSETVLLSPAALTYLTEVGAALGDLGPTDRGELLDEVQEHLLAIVDEAAGDTVDTDALIARLGSPAAYAAELRSAAGLPGASEVVRVEAGQGWTMSPSTERVLAATWSYLRSLAPAWWAVRGFLAAGLILSVSISVPGGQPFGWHPGLFLDEDGPSAGITGAGPYLVVVIVAIMLISIGIGLRQQASRWVWLLNQAFSMAGVIAVVACPMWWVGPSLYGYFRGRYGAG